MAILRTATVNGLTLEMWMEEVKPTHEPHATITAGPNMKVLGGGALVRQTVPAEPAPTLGVAAGTVDAPDLSRSGGPPHMVEPEPWLTGNVLVHVQPGTAPNEWTAAATDHGLGGDAGLIAMAVFADVPDDVYRMERETSHSDPHRSMVEAELPPNFTLTGGGGAAHPADRLLDASHPGIGSSWAAAAKDHMVAEAGTVTAWAIGLRDDFLRNMGLDVQRYGPVVSDPSAQPSTHVQAPPSRYVVGGGARAVWSNRGLLLTESYPDNWQGWRVAATSHQEPEEGQVEAWALAIGPVGSP